MTHDQAKDCSLQDDLTRVQLARLSLEGLSVGDAFGQMFFYPQAPVFLQSRELPGPPWRYTDDTAMATSIYEILVEFGGIDQDALAERFARRFHEEPHRGYGGMARKILGAIGRGAPWPQVSRDAIDGQGSMGNGGAMRVGPVGGYFADDLEAVVDHARRSAEVTHAHPEGMAGAVAIAVAAAQAYRCRGQIDDHARATLLHTAIDKTPSRATKDGLRRAADLNFDTPIIEASTILGNGSQVISQDTVPFCVWCAAKHLDDYEEAMWQTVSALGDRDTTCAIVGSIVALAVGQDGIPEQWRRSREPLEVSWPDAS